MLLHIVIAEDAVVSLRTLLRVLLDIEILLQIHSLRGSCVAIVERKARNLPSAKS